MSPASSFLFSFDSLSLSCCSVIIGLDGKQKKRFWKNDGSIKAKCVHKMRWQALQAYFWLGVNGQWVKKNWIKSIKLNQKYKVKQQLKDCCLIDNIFWLCFDYL